MMVKKNIFQLPDFHTKEKEVFEELIANDQIKIERIITQTPFDDPGEWYNQKKGEWVLLLQGNAELEFKDKGKVSLTTGDYLYIPAHKIHRISKSGHNEKCIWLAIHGNLK